MRERLRMAVARGFRAIKIEEGPGLLGNVDLATDVAVVRATREVIGEEPGLQSVASAIGTFAALSCATGGSFFSRRK